MHNDARWILNAVDLAFSACETIQEVGACDRCPLFATCLEESNFIEVATSFNKDHWAEFLGLSDDAVNYVSEQDYIADIADRERKEIDYGY